MAIAVVTATAMPMAVATETTKPTRDHLLESITQEHPKPATLHNSWRNTFIDREVREVAPTGEATTVSATQATRSGGGGEHRKCLPRLVSSGEGVAVERW